jgi:hypothetical protein
MAEVFDLERLRHAWNRTEPAPATAPLHPRLEGVTPAVDPHAEARAALERAGREAARRFPAHAGAVETFLDEARGLLAAVEVAAPGEREEPLAAFVQAVDRLEDLLEAFRLAESAGRSR